MATTISETSSAVIDDRRAQQLIERAMSLAERNDLSSAVLACRQAIALAPQTGQSYSMLGLLLERSGDTGGAIAAYEKVLEFAPDSFLERESLSRLRGAASQRQNARDMFAFDDNELFGEDTSVGGNISNALPTAADAGSTPSVEVAAATSAANIPSDDRAPAAKAGAAANNAAANNKVGQNAAADDSARAGSTPGISAATPTTSSANSATAPAKANSSAGAANRSGSMPFPSQISRPAGVGVPLDLPMPRAARQSAWQRMKQRPTAYFRGVPLAGATAISLMFLLWANNYASSNRAVGGSAAAPIVTENPFDNPTLEAPRAGTSPANPALTNQPANTGAVPTNPGITTAPANPGAPASSTPAPTNPAAAPTNPATAGATPQIAQSPQSTPGVTGGNAGVGSASAAPGSSSGAAPANNGGVSSGNSSSGGAPVAVAGTPKEYVRVTPAGGTPVARPENRAATEERNARSDAQAGRQDAAVDNLSRAIESGGPDVALRYQQRAQLYLQNNDGARASSDFQAAISAYNDMIARGDRVQIARSGIAACRRGLQMAQARR